ncbi:wall-associated receptor kinase-like 20 [Ricinus communis]|uniref:Kinase, putative n=1 Tax=Ricinus communis TaxID=3988 RepID=B9SE06_RICCO|nr:wall-associated receptor kinase-like 20 [Ricinus communis]EEF38149.1 kinase, putative [Ricinus communis]|eukprot:XP_002524225.1 wall-associated receptor kinase-like 20 [Ricinus communis]
MKPTPSPPPYHLLLTAALLLTFAVSTFSAIQCPNCGNMSVPYPLSTGPTCGDQSYKITCNASTLVFDTVNNSYPIISIDQSTQRLVIQPADIIPNTCMVSDYIHQGIQLNSSLPFNITSSNTVMLMNCSESILDQPLDCSATSLCHLYANSTRGRQESPCADFSLCCTYKAGGSPSAYRIRIREAGGCRAYKIFVNLDTDLPVDRWQDPGLEIQWEQPQEPVCGSQVDCDGSSACGPDPNISGVKRCYCKVGLRWDPTQGICAQPAGCEGLGGCGDRSRKTALIAGLSSSLSVLLLAITIGVPLYKHNKGIKEAQERLARHREEILSADGSKTAKLFTGKEIKKATNSFSKDRLIGAGGYGEVYKGVLDDGTVVAVKCAKLGNTKSTDQLLNEVRILCQVNHRSLVGLLGCCVELVQPILVYEYIQNGTLLDHLGGLDGQSRLSWTCRLRIAHETAECLSYLHTSATPPIYHRDIKSSNILLDDKLNAKISDFGLSRLAYSDLSHISTCAQGTIGYIDPEYFRRFQLTDKSDVYSFGVVLLELLTSMKAIDFDRGEDNVNLVIYVQRMVEEEKFMEIIDPLLKEKASSLELESIKALALLALDCLEERRENRPSMKEVAEEIEYILTIAATKNQGNY